MPELHDLWTQLASERAAVAKAACWKLVSASSNVDDFLKHKLSGLAPGDQSNIARLIFALDSSDFDKREAATRDLESLGLEPEEALIRTLRQSESAEVRQRIKALLTTLHQKPVPAEIMRQLRAIQVLEQRASPMAQDILRTLAAGPPDSPQTRDARRALTRIHERAPEADQR